MTPRRQALAWLLLGPALVSGCARQTALVKQPGDAFWAGRLALRVDSDPVRNLSAAFELSGNASQGELRLFTPLGSTVSSLHWAPGSAQLRSGGETRNFESLDALSMQLTGAAIPVAALFQWLSGVNASGGDWQADLSQLEQGRLTARRAEPAPTAELRLVLER